MCWMSKCYDTITNLLLSNKNIDALYGKTKCILTKETNKRKFYLTLLNNKKHIFNMSIIIF